METTKKDFSGVIATAVGVVLVILFTVWHSRASEFAQTTPLPTPAVWKNGEFERIELVRGETSIQAEVWLQAKPGEQYIARFELPGRGITPFTVVKKSHPLRGLSESVTHSVSHQEYSICRYHLMRKDHLVDTLNNW